MRMLSIILQLYKQIQQWPTDAGVHKRLVALSSVIEKSIFHHKTENFDQPTIELLLWTATAQLKDWSRFLLFVHLK